jgi:hypothetical protein
MQDLDALLKARLGSVTVKPMLEIIARHPAPEADIQSRLGQYVENRAFFGQTHGIIERENTHEIAHP